MQQVSIDSLQELDRMFEGEPESPQNHAPAPAPKKKRKRFRVWGVISGVLVVGLIAVGVAGLISTAVAPEWTEEVVGNAVGNAVAQVQQTAVDAGVTPPPLLTLAGPGGQAELDRCDGTWTQMVQYIEGGVPQPVHSAHNGCGGNPLLTLEMGGTIDVRQLDGTVVTYQAVDERRVAQVGTTTADIMGMGGDLILQTCFWDNATMRFLGLSPVEGADPA